MDSQFTDFFLIIVSVLYLQGYFKSKKSYQFENFPTSESEMLSPIIASLSDSLIISGRIINFWVEAKEIYSARIEAIQKAKYLIQVETYIMTPGYRANEFAQEVIKKAKEGVKVQLLVDSYGTKSISNSYWKKLEKQGIEVRKFNQLNWRNPLKVLRRNHRKLVIIDNTLALIGGAGISDHWDGWSKIGDKKPWFDYEIGIKGNIISRLSGLFWQHWLDTGGVVNIPDSFLSKYDDNLQDILVTANDFPTYQNSSIRALFQTLILSARKRIWIASPYFLPNSNSMRLLCDAKKRGVDVRILTMGRRCDKGFVRKSSRELYKQLLKEKISIHEYEPSMMHAKIILVDHDWVSLGSANFDPRSFFQNDELNLCINQSSLIKKVEDFFAQGLSKSKQVTLLNWHKRNLSDRLIGSLCLLFYGQL